MIHFPAKERNSEFVLDLPASGVRLDLGEFIAVMGILNVSPDSFYRGYGDESEALRVAERLIEEGADIIDIGAQSTRPGAEEIPEEEEIKRIKIIGKIRREFPRVPISVDTYRARVAREAFELGADMLNDISGFRFSPGIEDVCAEFGAPAVVMHTTAKSSEMQKKTLPDHELIPRIKSYLSESVRKAEEKGIKVVVDPGIGFGKKPHQNLIIINRLEEFSELGRPVLVGPSRKSFIGFALSEKNPPPPEERLEGTISACVVSVMKGARVVRVHDPLAVRRALKVAISIIKEKFTEEKNSAGWRRKSRKNVDS